MTPGTDRARQTHARRGLALLARADWGGARTSLGRAIACGDDRRETALNLALAAARLGDVAAAADSLAALERRCPDWDEPSFRLAELARDAGDTAAAAAAYRRALQRAPRRTEALLRLATLHLLTGAPRPAESLLIRCIGVAPQCWQAWDALGVAASMLGDRPAARSAFRRALSLNPADLGIALRLAGMAASLGSAAAELSRFEAASAADPLNVALLAGRAALLAEAGHEDDSRQLLDAAAAIAPDSALLAAYRAERLLRGGHHAQALTVLRHACALDPADDGLHNNLAVALTRTHRYAEAVGVLDTLAAREGERLDMLCNRANALVCLGRQEEGVVAARRATQLPGAAADRHLAWRTLANALSYSPSGTGAAMTAVMRQVAASAPRPDRPPLDRRPGAPRTRVRIGLLSATLKTHPVGWLTLAGLENLDPAAFDIVCIGQPEGRDPMQRRFAAIASAWHPWAGTDPARLPDRVRDLRLDMLIDLGGYGDQGLLGLCAQRLAPVQVKWVGMQNHTTGMAEIDWFVSDRWETPPELEPLYTERLLLLPDGYVCYAPPVHAPAVAPLPALRHGAVTFGCFNNLAKVTPRVVAVWAEILDRVPGSRLVLKTHQLADPATAGFVTAGFAAHGIAADRIACRGGSHHRELLGEYADIDIVLDPFPYSGGLTTCEALWMGVPVLTCPGETFASRHSASHLANIGCGDWVAPDLPAYVAQAVRRAGDIAALAALRAGLRERMRDSPLCDAPRFGRNLGAALRRAWAET